MWVDGVNTSGMVPFADMPNHDTRLKQLTYAYNEELKGFTFVAETDIPKGEPVYISYGRKCNTRFFLHYGFIYLDNESNEVPITISLDKNDPLYESKLGIVGATLESVTYKLTESLDGKVIE